MLRHGTTFQRNKLRSQNVPRRCIESCGTSPCTILLDSILEWGANKQYRFIGSGTLRLVTTCTSYISSVQRFPLSQIKTKFKMLPTTHTCNIDLENYCTACFNANTASHRACFAILLRDEDLPEEGPQPMQPQEEPQTPAAFVMDLNDDPPATPPSTKRSRQ